MYLVLTLVWGDDGLYGSVQLEDDWKKCQFDAPSYVMDKVTEEGSKGVLYAFRDAQMPPEWAAIACAAYMDEVASSEMADRLEALFK